MAGINSVIVFPYWCRSQVVRQRSAKPLYAGAIPAGTSIQAKLHNIIILLFLVCPLTKAHHQSFFSLHLLAQVRQRALFLIVLLLLLDCPN